MSYTHFEHPILNLTNDWLDLGVLSPYIGRPSAQGQIVLLLDLILGSADYLEVRLLFSRDGLIWIQEQVESIDSGVTTLEDNVYRVLETKPRRIPVPIADNYLKIQARAVGTATGSSAELVIAIK